MSSSDVLLRAQGLSKVYNIRHQENGRYVALRDVISQKFGRAAKYLNPFNANAQMRNGQSSQLQQSEPALSPHEQFWALKDINFEIRKGERVGIIGHNGAGKSTLLKILSRITEPTSGMVEMRGRVASLLEVGTGFHPELTGRENIYLNGSILGMSRREIRSKFDEIVDFSEVERFLDTPVKRYSSGMYVRLAFSVAAHLEPEILVVDEVLAVGDASFQKKCLGKMEDVAEREGRTVLFVSHQMSTIEKLCDKAFLLSEGRLIASGKTTPVIKKYTLMHDSNKSFNSDLTQHRRKSSQQDFIFKSITTTSNDVLTSGILKTGEVSKIILGIKSMTAKAFDLNYGRVAIRISNYAGSSITLSSDTLDKVQEASTNLTQHITFTIPKLPLTPGIYQIGLYLESFGNIQDWIVDDLSLTVESGDFYGSGRIVPEGSEGYSFLVDFNISVN